MPQNPKDLTAEKKLSISNVPVYAIAACAQAFEDGARKYGPYNWRGNKVLAKVYVDACFRHIMLWFEREENAKDSGVHHLGHAMACLAILLDAQASKNLIDDRPISDGGLGEILAALMGALNKAHAEAK